MNSNNFFVRSRTLLLGIIIIFALCFGSAIASDLPSAYYYSGEKIDLKLDTNQLMVQFSSNSSAGERAIIAVDAGIDVSWSEAIGTKEWHRLGLNLPLSDLASANDAIEALLVSQEIEFASPIFHGVILAG